MRRLEGKTALLVSVGSEGRERTLIVIQSCHHLDGRFKLLAPIDVTVNGGSA